MNTSYSCYDVAHGLLSIMPLDKRYKLLTLILLHKLLKYYIFHCPELIERLHFRINSLNDTNNPLFNLPYISKKVYVSIPMSYFNVCAANTINVFFHSYSYSLNKLF